MVRLPYSRRNASRSRSVEKSSVRFSGHVATDPVDAGGRSLRARGEPRNQADSPACLCVLHADRSLGYLPEIVGKCRRGVVEPASTRLTSARVFWALASSTISALYGFSHNIVTQEQYSFLVAVVITSAVVPTLIAGLAFLPRHLLPKIEKQEEPVPRQDGLGEEG